MSISTSSSPPSAADDALVDEREAAAILRLNARTLRNWRYQHRGPLFEKIGLRLVRYRRSDLERFIKDGERRFP